MNVTHETILVTLVRKDARVVELEAEVGNLRALLAAAAAERDNLLAALDAAGGEGTPGGG